MEVLQPLAIHQKDLSLSLGTLIPCTTSTAISRTPTPLSFYLQQPPCLLSLPAELRLEVYAYLLLSRLHHVPRHLLPFGPLLYPAILSTCRLVNAEATALLYAHNIFTAHSSLLTSLPHHASPQRPLLAPSCVSQVRHWRIVVRLDCDVRFSVEAARRAFNGAETLVVEAEQSMFKGAGYGVLLALEGVRGVKVARVKGGVDPDIARWLEGRMMSDEEWDGGTEVSDFSLESWMQAGR